MTVLQMKTDFLNEAAIPNPALDPLKILIGEWNTVGTHPLVPGTIFHGHTSFAWLEAGAFLLMRSEMDEPEIPNGIAIFGSDDAAGSYYMLYFDERQVSRKYEVSFRDNILERWRDTPDFSQRFTWTFADHGNTIISKGEMRRNGKDWEKDLELSFTRVKKITVP
jgi:hypothetical protein